MSLRSLRQFFAVVLFLFGAASGQDGLSPQEIVSRQAEITADTFQVLQSQLSLEVYYLETKILELENRVRALEVDAGLEPGGPVDVPERPPRPTDGPRPEPQPERPEESDRPVTEMPRRTRKPKPGKPNKRPEPAAAVTEIPPVQPTTHRNFAEPTTLPPFATYDKTCAEIYNHGYIYSGEYTIDSDGDNGPLAPFTVYCNMENENGVTWVGHSDEQDNIPVNGYENPGSFHLQPIYNYDVTMEQLGALADASKYCRQYVKYACRQSPLMKVEPNSGMTYAWWVDRNGDKHANFGGAPTDSGKCGCAYGGDSGDENTCFKGTETCSCDNPKAKNQQDEGDFTDKSLLPVMSINLGGTGKKKSRGAITLGKLICEG